MVEQAVYYWYAPCHALKDRAPAFGRVTNTLI